MRVLSLFDGISTGMLALQRAGISVSEYHACEIDKHAIKISQKNFPEIIQLGDVTKLDIQEGQYDLLLAGFPCFIRDTLILTKTGYKPIQDVELGEEVLTHRRRWRKVIQKHVTPNRKIRKLRISGAFDIYTTDEHPFYSKTTIHTFNNERRSNELVVGTAEWILAKNLENRFVGHTYIPNKNDVYSVDGYNQDHWWLIGRCLADGWVVNRKDRGDGGVAKVVLCCGYHEEIEDKISKCFNFSKSEERTTKKYHITNKKFATEFHKAGRLAHNKFIPNDWLRLSKENLKSLIEGYLSGDGSVNKFGHIRVSSVSKKLMLTLQMAILKVYDKQSHLSFSKRPNTCVIEGRTVNQRDSYSLSFVDKDDDYKKSFTEMAYGWSRCVESSDTGLLDTVYNIGVEEDESYIADGCVVHNCQAWSSAGKQLGLADPRGQLALTMFDIFKKLKPKYFMFENVASMSKGNKAFLDALIGYEGTTIDSGLVSAQNRRRIYWSNFPITQPEDRGIMLQDILQDGFVDREKSYCIDANYFKGGNLKSYFEKRRRQLVFRDAIAWSSSGRGNGIIEDRFRLNDKANTLMASGTGCGGAKTLNIVYSNNGIRILTPTECERLMGVPDGYTEGISNTQRYKCLGNGWEGNTVTHIFKDLKNAC